MLRNTGATSYSGDATAWTKPLAHGPVVAHPGRSQVVRESDCTMKILILGGTEDARQLAAQLVKLGHDVTTSLAGRTSEPLLPEGAVRIGGFGGGDGMGNYILSEGFERLVDATHPYAVEIKHNAVRAAEFAGVPLVRLLRPGWREPQYAFWKRVESVEAAAEALPRGARALLTVGFSRLEPFLARTDCSFVIRTIEPPERELPVNVTSILARPPYFFNGELALLQEQGVTHLICKNSGGAQTEAKLQAALRLRLPVFMIERPELPPAYEVPTVGRTIAALKL